MNTHKLAVWFFTAVIGLVFVVTIYSLIIAAICGPGKVAVRDFWGWPVCVRSE